MMIFDQPRILSVPTFVESVISCLPWNSRSWFFLLFYLYWHSSYLLSNVDKKSAIGSRHEILTTKRCSALVPLVVNLCVIFM